MKKETVFYSVLTGVFLIAFIVSLTVDFSGVNLLFAYIVSTAVPFFAGIGTVVFGVNAVLALKKQCDGNGNKKY
ncbi:MAG: hypothetical protein LBP79_06360 [Clostridiales bacterium]|jgi:hypothetical protein|nr:hypothetical protein [Clostridiales bacterium]